MIFGIVEDIVVLGVVLVIVRTSKGIHRAIEHLFVARTITDAFRTTFSAPSQ